MNVEEHPGWRRATLCVLAGGGHCRAEAPETCECRQMPLRAYLDLIAELMCEYAPVRQ